MAKSSNNISNTKEKLINATIETLCEYGFNNSTDTIICEKANVTRGALYHHYKKGKIDLLKDVLQHLNEYMYKEMDFLATTTNLKKVLILGIENMLSNSMKKTDNNSMAVLEIILATRYDKKMEKEILPLITEYEKFFWGKMEGNPHYGLLRFFSTYFRGYSIDTRIFGKEELNKGLKFVKSMLESMPD